MINEPNSSTNPLSAADMKPSSESPPDSGLAGGLGQADDSLEQDADPAEFASKHAQSEHAQSDLPVGDQDSPVQDSPSDSSEASGAAEAGSDFAAEEVAAEEVAAEEVAAEEVAAEEVAAEEVAAEEGPVEEVQPLEEIEEEIDEEELAKQWYILKVQVNREDSIRDALVRRVKIEGLEEFFGDIIVPTEDVVEFTKTGRKRIVKRKLYPGYLLVYMAINDDTWFLVRETPGIGDFTGSAGKPTPMLAHEVEKILRKSETTEDVEGPRVDIPFEVGDRVRVKDGNFQNFEGDVETVDESNGRVTVMINIFGRSTPVEFEHWQIEKM